GAPHFFSRTTLRPLGPSVTLTASASWFMPRSRPRRASSSNAISLAAIEFLSSRDRADTRRDEACARDGRSRPHRSTLLSGVVISQPRFDQHSCLVNANQTPY